MVEEFEVNEDAVVKLTSKTKTHAGKLRLDLLPIRALEDVTKAFQWGVENEGYPAWDWLTINNWEDIYFAATLRHLFEWRKGVTKDEKSGLSPLIHAAANLLIMITRSR